MSTFTVNPGKKIAGFGGKKLSVPMYLQFTPGYCSEVLHSSENQFHETPNHTNSIIAVPHHSEKIFKTKATSVGKEDRYYPLFRTMHDVPTKGDSVLLTNIGGVNYYLGPLNMDSNNPTWNPSRYKVPELAIPTTQGGETSERGEQGESVNFNKNLYFNRLAKVRKTDLDYGKALRETTGDTLIEGRHGNSLRIGSRSNNPYVFISNERAFDNEFETLGDGTLISITSNGTLKQHFDGYVDKVTQESKEDFQLDSDALTDTVNKLGKVWSDVNGQPPAALYEYDTNQFFLRSDRIIFNTKNGGDIVFGSNNNISICAPKEVVIEADTTKIGSVEASEPLVLGAILESKLNDILTLIETGLLAPTGPVVVGPGAGLLASLKSTLSQIKSPKNLVE